LVAFCLDPTRVCLVVAAELFFVEDLAVELDFLVDVAALVEAFLVEVVAFLVEVVAFLVEVEAFLVEVEAFLVDVAFVVVATLVG